MVPLRQVETRGMTSALTVEESSIAPPGDDLYGTERNVVHITHHTGQEGT